MGVNLVGDKLFYIHGCQGCSNFPSSDLDNECPMCGWTQRRINEVKEKCEIMTKLYQEYKDNPIKS